MAFLSDDMSRAVMHAGAKIYRMALHHTGSLFNDNHMPVCHGVYTVSIFLRGCPLPLPSDIQFHTLPWAHTYSLHFTCFTHSRLRPSGMR